MFVVGNIVIDEDIPRATFCCDLPHCLGACCTIAGEGGRRFWTKNSGDHHGVPLCEAVPESERPEDYRTGWLIRGNAGDFATRCVDGHECVFAYFEGGIARCSLDRAFGEGRTTWRKPLSCHLFPLRVGNSVKDLLRYQQMRSVGPVENEAKKRRSCYGSSFRSPSYAPMVGNGMRSLPCCVTRSPSNPC